jgi:hypothetical protein
MVNCDRLSACYLDLICLLAAVLDRTFSLVSLLAWLAIGLAGVAHDSMARESFVHGWSGLRGLEPATPCHEAMNEAMKP